LVRDFLGQPIEGATVTIVTGPNAGATRTTGKDGRFAFNALPTTAKTVSLSPEGLVDRELDIGPRV